MDFFIEDQHGKSLIADELLRDLAAMLPQDRARLIIKTYLSLTDMDEKSRRSFFAWLFHPQYAEMRTKILEEEFSRMLGGDKVGDIDGLPEEKHCIDTQQ